MRWKRPPSFRVIDGATADIAETGYPNCPYPQDLERHPDDDSLVRMRLRLAQGDGQAGVTATMRNGR